MLVESCPCCSGKPYDQCCQPIHLGNIAPDPAALMRSRFAAHALGLFDYILASWSEGARSEVDQAGLQQWLAEARFGRLRVIAAETDWVEFECWYRQNQQLEHLHDRSFFVQEQGHWRYHRSEAPRCRPEVIGRNDACPCGSGKKYKKCCGNS